MKIGYLDFVEQERIDAYSEFHKIGAGVGVAFEHISLEGVRQGESAAPYLAKWTQILDTADIYIIRGNNLPDDSHKTRILTSIKGGKSAIFLLHDDNLEELNPFLAHFGMTGTSFRLYNKGRNSHPGMVNLYREQGSFRSLDLFSGIDTVTIHGPRAIWYTGEALPLLVVTDQQFVVDSGDLVTTHNPRQCACMAGWVGDAGQVVLAIAGGMLHDAYDGATGVHWPGIAENRRFATNLLRYFQKTVGHVAPEERIDGNSLCDRIEMNLVDFVLKMLKAAHPADWWTQYVPTPIRTSCAARQEEEGNKFDREAYLDLIDLRTIMDKNWTLFDPHFRAEGLLKKADAIDWIDKLNKSYRRMAGHPLKRAVTGFSYSTDDLDFLNKYDVLSRKLNLRDPPIIKAKA